MSSKYTIVRLSRGGEDFEILVDPDKALEYKMGSKLDVASIVVVDEVFTDANKGIRASREKLMKAFGTTDFYKIASTILEKGRLLITAEQRRRLTEMKKRQVIELIRRSYVDPRTKLPHTAVRIEQAMKEAHVSIDPFKPAEEQVQPIIKAISRILPLKAEKSALKVRIPARHSAKAYGLVRRMCKIVKEEWRPDGSWFGVVELPAGMRGEFMEKLAKLTKGEASVEASGG